MFRKCLAALIVASCLGSSAFASYGAIAYSASTGKSGYTYNYCQLGDAENDAITYCDASDAVVVAWSSNEWCALAVSDDGSYGWASGLTQEEAESAALANCTGNAHVEVSIFSGSE